MPLSIISVTTIEQCRQIEELQEQIWHTGPLDVIPDHVLITAAKNGGVVLLASLNNRPIGLAFGFQGETAQGQRKHCSHVVGVLPGKQSSGIGYQIKLAQREAVLTQGIELITWTYDPLISRNAYLNVGKLGAVSRHYVRNMYGAMRSNINMGLESDRLEVHWRLNSRHVIAKLRSEITAPPFDENLVLNPASTSTKGLPAPAETIRPLTESVHFLQIPADIEAIKQTDMSLAIAWREQTRALFESAFSAGYSVSDFVRQAEQNESYYVLKKE